MTINIMASTFTVIYVLTGNFKAIEIKTLRTKEKFRMWIP